MRRGQLNIREARISDLKAITAIYNEAIRTTVATFDTEAKNLAEQKAWFKEHHAANPVLIAELSGTVVGWASLSKWSDRCAYSATAEISLYVSESYQGRGIGRELMQSIVDAGRQAGLHTVIARIAEGNEASVHLHESLGFKHIGVMKEVGRKFGRLLDVYLMQLIYKDVPTRYQ